MSRSRNTSTTFDSSESIRSSVRSSATVSWSIRSASTSFGLRTLGRLGDDGVLDVPQPTALTGHVRAHAHNAVVHADELVTEVRLPGRDLLDLGAQQFQLTRADAGFQRVLPVDQLGHRALDPVDQGVQHFAHVVVVVVQRAQHDLAQSGRHRRAVRGARVGLT